MSTLEKVRIYALIFATGVVLSGCDIDRATSPQIDDPSFDRIPDVRGASAVLAVARSGQTTVDMANGPIQRLQPFPETIALLESMGAKNNHRCVSC